MPTTRRHFLRNLTLASPLAGTVIARAGQRPRRLPLAFSTLGCPAWTWREILDRASEWGYVAIELRGLHGEMDLTRSPDLTQGQLGTRRRELEARGLVISDLGSSARLHDPPGAARSAQLDEGRRYIDLAHRLRAPYVRVFGDRVLPGQPREASLDRVIAGLRELGAHARGSGVSVLIESHGDYCDTPTLERILGAVGLPTVGLLWDAHHTVMMAHEGPATTFARLGRYVRHVHLKDSVRQGDGVRYVLPGEGVVPLREIVRTLVAGRYRGYYCFEWEKVWHPEIAPPEVAFPRFAKLVGGYLGEAGIRPR